MTILDNDQAIYYLAKWLIERKNEVNKNGFLIELANRNSLLAAKICEKTKSKTYLVINKSNKDKDKKLKLIKENIKLKNFKIIQIDDAKALSGSKDLLASAGVNLNENRLKYFLKPVISFIAKDENLLIINCLSRNHYRLIRDYKKDLDVHGDLLLFSDIYQSELDELYFYATKESNNINECFFNLNITHSEVEWLDRKDVKTNVVTNCTDPAKSREWPSFTGRQKQIISYIHQVEKSSRHRQIFNVPECKIRNKEGLIK